MITTLPDYANPSSVSAQATLEQRFGPIDIQILYQSQDKRVSVRRTSDGIILAYNYVVFSETSKKYSLIHERVLSGIPIAKAIQEQGNDMLRLETCAFQFTLPTRFKGGFMTTKNESTIKSVGIYIDRFFNENHYADILEIYSPVVGINNSSFEVEKGLIEKTRIRLDELLSL